MGRAVPRTPRTKAITAGAVFAERLREARNARGWRQQDLADEMGKLGMPMDRTTIAKLEKGQREVRLDELVALAVALDVALVHLVLPIEGDESSPIEGDKLPVHPTHGPPVKLTPKREVDQVKARRWARGDIPLDPANYRSYAEQSPGDKYVSAEELSPDDLAALEAERERQLRKWGVVIEQEQGPPATKRGQRRRKES
jgi:transcriptional regulator with XRE-family HTH domain